MTSGAAPSRHGPDWLRDGSLGRWRWHRLVWPTLAAAVIASGLLLFHLSRDTSFWADEWTWIITRRSNTVHAFLAPYNGHLSLVPIAIYRLMFAVFGLGSYTPYRTLIIAGSLVVAVLAFVYMRARVGDLVALLLTVAMLFLGPGWQDTLWAFQIPWLIVCAAGLLALMLLDRGTAGGDAGACALLALAVCSTSLGLAFAVGIAVELALTRRRWQDAWIVVVPLVMYGVWALYYRPSQIDLGAIPTIPLNVADAAATALSSLVGQSGLLPFGGNGTSLIYGWPLVVLAGALALWRARSVRPPARALTLAVIFVAFAASVSIVHGEISSALASRYIYVYCLLAVLLVAELARGVRSSPPVGLALCGVALSAVVANVGNVRGQAAFFRSLGYTTNGALAALDLDRKAVPGSTYAQIAAYRFVKLTARAYFAVERALGTPAYTVEQLRGAPGGAQTAADSQLLADGDVTLTATTAALAPPSPANGAPLEPSDVAATSGSVTRHATCVRFTPAAALAPGQMASVQLAVPSGRVSVTSGAVPVSVAIRRFAGTFSPLGSVTAGHTATIAIRQDLAAQPWVLQLSSIAPITACTTGSRH